MSGELEAAGAAATAGLAAGAIERKGGAGPAGEGACLNCGAELEGAYCHACGQPVRISRTLGDVVADFFRAVLQIDTKTWRTLPMLVGRPGSLTHRYIHGQRARFVSPLAMFLFSVFTMFFVFTVVVEPAFEGPDSPVHVNRTPTAAEAQKDVDAALARRDKAKAELAAAEGEAAQARARGEPGAEGVATGILAGPKADLADAERELAAANTALAEANAVAERRAKALNEASQELANTQRELATEAPVAAGAVRAAKQTVDVAAARGATPAETATPATDNVVGVAVKDGALNDADDLPWQEKLRRAVESGELKIDFRNKQIDQKVRAALMNADLALYKLQETASKFSFLLVPISLPFIALLFLWRRGVTLFDHVVFSLYSLSFMSFLLVTIALVARVGGEPTAPFLAMGFLVGAPTHLYFHLKGTYALGWWSALWRTVMLSFFAVLTLSLFALAILALGVLS